MNCCNTVVGLDVHKTNIAVSVLPPKAERAIESLMIENSAKTIEKLVRRIGAKGPAEFVYEAGPCGYQVQRQIEGLGHRCAVIATFSGPQG